MIFLIGGKGFVGSALARVCAAQGREFAIIELDNYAEFAGRSCDILINANGNSKKFLAQQNPLAEFDASVRSVRASLVDFSCRHYVHISTCDVYPDCSTPANTQEGQALEVACQSAYGFHKYLAEQCVRHAAPSWLIFRMGGFVGPGLRKNPIYDILHGGPLWLQPDSALQFLPTDSMAQIILELIDRRIEGEIFNLCGRGVISLREVMQLAGVDVPVQPGSPCVRYEVSIEKISQLINIPETTASVAAFVKAGLNGQ